jgi:hypothetical protein
MANKESTSKKDLAEMKITLAIMQREIERLEKHLKDEIQVHNKEDLKEIWEMRNNNEADRMAR